MRLVEYVLGKFMIEFIEVKCEVKNDKCIVISVIFKDIKIDDKRK